VTELDEAVVGAHLGLGDEYRPWLDSLQAVGPPPDGLLLPRGEEAAALLQRMGVVDPDLTAILEAMPSPDGSREWWWLLERSYHQLCCAIGQPDAPAVRSPAFPDHLGAQGRCFWIYVFLAAVPAILRWHRARGIPEDISWATLSDLGRHVGLHRRRFGATGLDSPRWLGLHFGGALFALGRLQFTPYRLRTGLGGPLFWYDDATLRTLGPGFQPGNPVLGVHIPEAGPLTPASCDESFRSAKAFFPKHFPEQTYRIATCTSWLLDDQLAAYLPPESNIVRFQRRFELVPGARDDDAIFRYVFDRVPASLDELSPQSRLDRAVVAHVRAGGRWRVRTGWLEL